MFCSFDSYDSWTLCTTLTHNPIKQKLEEVGNPIVDFAATYEKLFFCYEK